MWSSLLQTWTSALSLHTPQTLIPVEWPLHQEFAVVPLNLLIKLICWSIYLDDVCNDQWGWVIHFGLSYLWGPTDTWKSTIVSTLLKYLFGWRVHWPMRMSNPLWSLIPLRSHGHLKISHCFCRLVHVNQIIRIMIKMGAK